MRSTNSRAAIRAARTALAIFAVLLLGYLVLLALDPAARLAQPEALRWFGSPGSVPTIAVVVAVLVILAGLILHTRGIRETGAPVAVVAGLAMISLVLGLASYWDCHDETHPRFFTALMWTANLVKGVSVNSRSPLGGARRHRRSPLRSPALRPWRPCSSAWSALPRRCSAPVWTDSGCVSRDR